MYFALMSEGQSRLTLEDKKIRELMEPPKKERFHENLRFRFVRGLAVCSAVMSPLLLISFPSAFVGGQEGFSITVFTSPDDQFWANSVIIEGEHEVMLVDAQLTKTSAEKVLQEIKKTKKPLSIIYITHEHADHFLGLEIFKEAYPRVRIIANSAVVERINKVYQEKIDKWKGILGSRGTSHVVVIEKFDGDFIKFESSKIEVLKKAKDPDSLVNAMKEKFPSADLLLAIERGAKANVEHRQTN